MNKKPTIDLVKILKKIDKQDKKAIEKYLKEHTDKDGFITFREVKE